jgi:hypothetical protein
MLNQDRILFNKLTGCIKLAVAKVLATIKNSQDTTIAVSKDGKTIEFINLKYPIKK